VTGVKYRADPWYGSFSLWVFLDSLISWKICFSLKETAVNSSIVGNQIEAVELLFTFYLVTTNSGHFLLILTVVAQFLIKGHAISPL